MSEETKVSKAQQKAVQKYVKNNYDRVVVTLPKGRRDEVKKHASDHGESMNAFIVRAVNETMERDKA
nr:Arc family DNA-binding protein [uncultured Blautia sp.]